MSGYWWLFRILRGDRNCGGTVSGNRHEWSARPALGRSSPRSWARTSRLGSARGGKPATALASISICAGVVPLCRIYREAVIDNSPGLQPWVWSLALVRAKQQHRIERKADEAGVFRGCGHQVDGSRSG
jgi:hypothetical protein